MFSFDDLVKPNYCPAMSKKWKNLNQDIIECRKCPRLIRHCQKIAREKRKSLSEWNYWGRPIANFGGAGAEVLILGLAIMLISMLPKLRLKKLCSKMIVF